MDSHASLMPFGGIKGSYASVRVELGLVCGFSRQECCRHAHFISLLNAVYQPPSQLALATGQTLEPTKSYLCDDEMDYLSSPF